MKKISLFLATFILIIYVFSCDTYDESVENFTAEGLRPVYISMEEADTIKSLSPQPVDQLGKIYYKDDLIYVGEQGRGVHIIDNTNPAEPSRIGFIQIPGNKDITIKGNLMYADNFRDLLTIDISDMNNVIEIDRIADVYAEIPQSYPIFHNGYFECVDPSKGLVMKWETAMLENPACQR